MASIHFSHVALSCQDPLETERFYTRHFGFERARVISLGETQIVFLKAGGVYLELFSAEGDAVQTPSGDGPHTAGLRHLAFQVENIDEALSAMGEAAKITLGPLDFSAFIPNWRTVWVSDPDGNIVEISQGFQDEDSPPPLV